jgi:succinate dehydrogenase / fumarate reductase flavoprotein subunit
MAEAYTTKQYDVLVIGAGGAGLRAAIEVAQDPSVKVAVVCKSLLGKAHTVMAEGGAAAALGNVHPDDNWRVHFRDTLKGGKLLNNWRMAEILVKEGPDRILELEKWGAVFDRTPEGKISQRPFGGHSYSRLAHVGDRTGLEMIRTLQDHAIHQPIDFFMEYTVIKLFTKDGKVTGALSYDRHTGEFILFEAKSIVIATGGCARCFTVQTNSWEGTGDGHSLAYQAGAELMDMEFLQFHPTGMVWPLSVKGLLVTEAVRGEGAILKNSKGERFMFNYIPEAFKNDVADTEAEANRWVAGDKKNNRKPPELLTRDVLARAILAEIKAGRGSAHGGAYLDIASQRSPEYIKRKLPSMYHQFKELASVDITKDPMEVGPAAHYIMGGIRVDADTTETTTVKGLFASGEVAAGLHGANRLGGNSLTDIVVFGKRSGEYALKFAKENNEFTKISVNEVEQSINDSLRYFSNDAGHGENPYSLQLELKVIMNDHCGIIRNGSAIQEGITKLQEIKERLKQVSIPQTRLLNTAWHTALDLENLLVISEALAKAGLERTESRGAHTRDDYQGYDNELGKLNIILSQDTEGTMQVRKESLPELPEELQQLMRELDK